MITPDMPLAAVPFAVVDVETTGLNPATGDRVCEVAVRPPRGFHGPALSYEPLHDCSSHTSGSPGHQRFHGTSQVMSCTRVIFGL